MPSKPRLTGHLLWFAVLCCLGGTAWSQASRTLTGNISASPEPSTYQNTFTLTVNFLTPMATSPAVTGTVSFAVDGMAVGTATVSGNSASTGVNAAQYVTGLHTITASYLGDINYDPVVATGQHQVTKLRSSMSLTVTTTTIYYGQTADAVAQVGAIDNASGATLNGGTITFYADGVNICQLIVTGMAESCPSSAGNGFPAGPHTLYATYSGNQYYDPSTSSTGNFTVLPDDTGATVASSTNPSPYGRNIVFSAKLSAIFATPTGAVNFFDGNTPIGTGVLDASGLATVDVSTLTVGTHSIAAKYPATQNFNSSSSTSIQQVIVLPPVVPLTTVTLLTSSANPSVVGQSVTFSASVASTGAFLTVPTGTVTFMDGTKVLGTGTVNAAGIASFTTSSLAAGQHPMTAGYGGPATFVASTSGMFIQNVTTSLTSAGDGFLLSVTPASISEAVGNSAGVVVTVLPLNGFSQPVALTCTGLPDGATCDYGSPTLPAVGGSTRLLISSTAPHNCDSSTPYFNASNAGGTGLSVLAAATVLLFTRRRRRFNLKNLGLLLLCLLPALSGCGSNCTDIGTKPGNYTITIQGTSQGTSPLTHTVPVQMNVHL